MNKDYQKCLTAVEQICKGQNFNHDEIHHRARILYLMNKLNFWEDFPVLLDEFKYQRTLKPLL